MLVRRSGDLADAEDALQEAMLAAAAQWPEQGVPDNPRAWLVVVGQNKLVDRYRSEEARRRREELVATMDGVGTGDAPDAGRLPAAALRLLPPGAQPGVGRRAHAALGGRAVDGGDRAGVPGARGDDGAAAQPGAPDAARAGRAVPDAGRPGVRRSARAVLRVLYLIFNEGYASSTGTAVARADLAVEAIRLTRSLHASLPDDPEVAGLLALVLLTDARRPARTGPRGELVPLAEQDRGLWDRDMIAEGVALVEDALVRGAVGEYQLQAAIAAVHDEAPTTDATDWPRCSRCTGCWSGSPATDGDA